MSDRIRAICFPVRRNIETTRSGKVAAEIRAGRSQRDAQSAPRLSPLWFESRLWVLHGGGIDPFFGWFLVQSSIGTLRQLCTVKAHVMQLAKKQIVQSKKGDCQSLYEALWSLNMSQYEGCWKLTGNGLSGKPLDLEVTGRRHIHLLHVFPSFLGWEVSP